MINQYYEPELVGDDIEDATQIPEDAQLLSIVDIINNLIGASTIVLVERED